jgi:hypothetical protein
MSTCGKYQACKTKKKSQIASWLPALLIAILPKCPFCIMAYSGAVSMCSGKMLYPHADATSSYVFLGLSIIIILGLLFNRKGKVTWIALGIVAGGISLLVISQFYYISEPLFYCAVALLFFGIWFNGSFKYFYRKYFIPVQKTLVKSLNLNYDRRKF